VCIEYPCTLIVKHKQILPSQHLLFNLISLIHAILIRLVTRLCIVLLVSLWYARSHLSIYMYVSLRYHALSPLHREIIHKEKNSGPNQTIFLLQSASCLLLKPMSDKFQILVICYPRGKMYRDRILGTNWDKSC
jgi:hypothetical protein